MKIHFDKILGIPRERAGLNEEEVRTLNNDKEDVSNKSTDTNLGTSNTLYPSQNAVKTYVDNGLSAKANLNGGNHFFGNQTIDGDTHIQNGNLLGTFSSKTDIDTIIKLTQGNSSNGYQDIHFIPDYVKGGDKSGNVSIMFGYNSEIDKYDFFSKRSGNNIKLFTIRGDNGNIGIGLYNPRAKLEIGGNGEGIILTSSGGNSFKITVDDNGNLTTTAV